MTASVEQVINQLLEVHEKLSAAAATAMRARADAEQAHSRYEAAATGSDHPKLRAAVVAIKTAADKSAKVARLLEQASAKVTTYLDHIAPGSAPTTDSALPTDDQLLVQDAHQRAESGVQSSTS